MTSPPRQDRRVDAAGPACSVPGARLDPATAGASRLSRVIAPLLREHGLTVTPYPAGGGEPRELAVTNPAFPGGGGW